MFMRSIVLVCFCISASFGQETSKQPIASVTGSVTLDGNLPEAKKTPLDKIMQKAIGESIYTDETWMVGKNKGLANCVITLVAVPPTKSLPVKPLEHVVLDKVGFRLSPKVLVVTSETTVTLRNKESPCRGFTFHGHPQKNPPFGELILEGKERKVVLKGPDLFPICCDMRPYYRGFVHVVDTPHFAVTDAQGRFAIENVPAGLYKVTGWHEGFGRFSEKNGPTQVKIEEGQGQDLTFRVTPRIDNTPAKNTSAEPVSTYSIVAFDPEKKEWGVGVASKFLAVGAVVPWAKAGVGAIATQSAANTSYGPKGLELLAQGKSPDEVMKLLTEVDKGKAARQVGIIDAQGNVATFTGDKCNPWAGGKTGKNYACQGNLLAGEAVVDDMAKAFEESTGPLAWRIITAMQAAEKAGGDKRGKQSAAILIVRDKGGYGGFNDRALDFRVDDHPDPVPELARILALRLRKK